MSPISAPALERLDTSIKFLSFPSLIRCDYWVWGARLSISKEKTGQCLRSEIVPCIIWPTVCTLIVKDEQSNWFAYLCVPFQESVDSLWLTEPSKKEKRRTSSQSINPTKQWQDKERIFKKDELDLRRVSLFGVSFYNPVVNQRKSRKVITADVGNETNKFTWHETQIVSGKTSRNKFHLV